MGTICPQLWVLCAMSEEKWHILHSLTVTSTGHDSELASQAMHLEPPTWREKCQRGRDSAWDWNAKQNPRISSVTGLLVSFPTRSSVSSSDLQRVWKLPPNTLTTGSWTSRNQQVCSGYSRISTTGWVTTSANWRDRQTQGIPVRKAWMLELRKNI